MPIQIALLSAVYIVLGVILILKYSGNGLYSDFGLLAYSDLIRAALPFFLFFLSFGLLTKRKQSRQIALYWVFTQYFAAFYFVMKVALHSGETPLQLAQWTPLFLVDLAARNPWGMCALVLAIAITQHWILSHPTTKRIYGDIS